MLGRRQPFIARTVGLATGAEVSRRRSQISTTPSTVVSSVTAPASTPTRCGTAALPSSVRAPVAGGSVAATLLHRSLTVLSVQRELAMAPDEYDQLKQAGVRWVRRSRPWSRGR